ncbi:hypothetical protein Vi05172_g2944 [Venturia inaequalis]|nr:hypothetical protein Vi05172_g2944 [Venturia inaequalis]
MQVQHEHSKHFQLPPHHHSGFPDESILKQQNLRNWTSQAREPPLSPDVCGTLRLWESRLSSRSLTGSRMMERVGSLRGLPIEFFESMAILSHSSTRSIWAV